MRDSTRFSEHRDDALHDHPVMTRAEAEADARCDHGRRFYECEKCGEILAAAAKRAREVNDRG